MYAQASNIIAKLGRQRVAEIAGVTPRAVDRWKRSRANGGNDGLVPLAPKAALWEAMKRGDVDLTEDDFLPEPREVRA